MSEHANPSVSPRHTDLTVSPARFQPDGRQDMVLRIEKVC